MFVRQPSHLFQIARLGRNDAGVAHHGLHEYGGHVAWIGFQAPGECIEIIPARDQRIARPAVHHAGRPGQGGTVVSPVQ
jgi:hypothetical protein